MKTRIKSFTAFILGFCMLVTVAASSVTTAHAYDAATGTYNGSESASYLGDFNGNITAQDKFKMWSIYKSMGMTDNQAIAALACSEAECHYRPEVVEGHSNTGTSEIERLTYLTNYSMHMDRNPDYRTQLTIAVINSYGFETYYNNTANQRTDTATDGAERKLNAEDEWMLILNNRPNKLSSFPSPTLNVSISLDTYFQNGVGYLGCGLYQFTGESLQSLFRWSSDHNDRWYNFENQMAFIMAQTTDGGYKGEALLQYMDETKDSELDYCVTRFAKLVVNGSMPQSQIDDRKAIAHTLENMRGVNYDRNYGNMVIKLSGLPVTVIRQGIQDRSILYSYTSSVAYYPLNSGSLLVESDNVDIENANQEIFKGYTNSLKGNADNSTTYSLYELYGEDIHWYRYMGEGTYSPTLLDHIWSAWNQNKLNELSLFDTILYDPYNYLSCNVYKGRPRVLDKTDIDNGYVDPRAYALKTGNFNGMLYVSGNIKLSISKGLVAIVSFLMGPQIRETIQDMLDTIEGSEVWDGIKPILMMIIMMCMVFFILSLVKKAVNYAKGTGAAKEAIERFLIGFLCLGFAFAAIARPSAFNGIIMKTVGIVDTLFNEGLQGAISNDEVIAVTDPDKAVQAVLWKTAIFNAWCRGQFDNRNYDELYTQYSAADDAHKMPQSHQQIDPTDMSDNPVFDSATLTGDVFVYVGGGKEIRNWAAYLYSCGSKYHIDFSYDADQAELVDTTQDVHFPHESLKTTAGNNDLAADLFRIIDAQMNISPQYFSSGGYTNNYTDAHGLKTHYDWQGTVMLFNAAMMIFFIPMIFKKLTSFIQLMLTIIKIIFYSIIELFKEQGSLKQFVDDFKKHFIDYFTACLKLNTMILLYYLLIDKGFIQLVLYILLCIVILSVKWNDVKYLGQNIKHNVNRVISKI